MNTNFIPGVRKVEYIYADTLPENLGALAFTDPDLYPGDWWQIGTDPHSMTPERIHIESARYDLCVTGEPELSVSVDGSGPLKSCSVELKFTCKRIIPEDRAVCFLVSLQSGKHLLIGTREPQFPRIDIVQKFGAPASNPRVLQVTVQHTSIHGVIPVTV